MLAKEVVARYGGRVEMVVEDFGDSDLARRFGVIRYPAVWVDEVLVARPDDFHLWQNDDGRYTPWRDAGNHRRFQEDLGRMIDRALAGGTVEGYTPSELDADRDELAALPEFSLLDLEGDEVEPGDLRGRPSVVEFWATWCPPCRSTLEWLDDLKRRHGDGLEVLAVSMASEEEAVRTLTAEVGGTGSGSGGRGAAYRVALGDDDVARAFGDVVGIPTLFVFDADGSVAGVFHGAPEGLHDRVQALLRRLMVE